MIRTNFLLALASIRSSKTRTFLTMVAVIIGIASYTIVTTTVDGLKMAAENDINGLGGNLVQIVPGKIIEEDENGNEVLNFAAAFGTSTVTESDVSDIAKLEGIKAISPLGIVGGQVSRGESTLRQASVIATNEQYPKAFTQEVEYGSFLKPDEKDGKFAVIGQGVVGELYGGAVTLGTTISVRGEPFTIVGVMEEVDTSISFGSFDLNNTVYISIENGKRVSNGALSIQEVDIQLEANVDANDFKKNAYDVLLENHGGEEDFTVLTQEELIELTDSLFGIIKKTGQYLSYVMLFVSSIVILLIMLITVRERTREIGIRKSIGATNVNILTQFLSEALVISWLGSGIGLLFGAGAGVAVKSLIDITPAYSVDTLVSLVLISTSVGGIAGAIPAWLAARKDPVEALRHE